MKWPKVGLVAAAMACSAGCAPRTASPPLPPSSAQWRMALTLIPAAPRQLDPVQMRVRIRDKAGRPITGAVVPVSLAMPAMDMGRNEVTLHEAPPGTYTGTGRFTMPGDWQATVSADKGAAHQAQMFPVSVH